MTWDVVLNLKQTAHLILKAITAVIPILDGVVTQMGIASVMHALILEISSPVSLNVWNVFIQNLVPDF